MSKGRAGLVGVGLAVAAVATPAAGAQETRPKPALACEIGSIQQAAPAGTTITAASPTASPVPHCRIDGYVTTTDPGPNQVNFRLQLPDQGWAGRYYFINLGGSAGYVPTDSQIPGGNPLFRGFAVAGTDTGRQGNMLDWTFLSDPVKALDHNHRGAHVVALATQQITRRYYGASKIFRYASGCSGGGRMGMEALSKHPEDFDGLLIGAPGGRGSGTILKFIAASQALMREPGAWLSPAKLSMVEQKVTAACDATDGAVDQLVWDHRLCHFPVETLACAPGKDSADCLTAPEMRSFKAILDGPRGPHNELLAQPMPITNTASWSTFLGQTPPPWSGEATMDNMKKGASGYIIATTISHAFFGPNYDPAKQFDLKNQKDIDAWWAAAKRTGWGTPWSSDLSGFQRAGGKVIFWNGASDPCCSDVELENIYRGAAKYVAGGYSGLQQFAKFYDIPGMAHCGGGTGPQDAPDALLNELVAWVEKGAKPGAVVAHRGADRVKLAFANPNTGQVSGVAVPPPSGPSRDFLLCPFPTVARFDARKARQSGAVYDAANWSCAATGQAK
jgi:feruloyl esterase